ncbi:uncharacterized protein LOC143570974 isoform X2 [Bidens hawaiensis]|uniref:uncharacterized protein LOC143570974 isoform X2 n=1 Tax=Bidens hawaiensis TaxID=980011 RepID=UPI00404BA3CE
MTSSSDDIHDSHDAVESLSPSIGNRNDEQKREIIIISDDEESFEYDGRIMTVETTNFITKCSKQVPHFEEQTTQKNTTRWIRRSMEDSRHDLSIMKSNDEKASQRDCGIMTAEVTNPITDGRKQMTASDQGSHFEEQTTQKNTTRWIRRLMEDSRHYLSIMKSNDEKSSQCDGGIMTAETNPITDVCKQATASDEVPHFEEQTTQKNTTRWIRRLMEDSRHDLSIMKSNDEKSSQCDGGIMTAETTNPITDVCKQATATDEVPHFEEQTTRMITKDVSDARQKESMCTHVSMKASRHDQSEKSSQCVGGIVISETANFVNECGKQVTASDEVPHFEEQTTRMITKDVSDARQKESMCTHVSMKASRHDQSEKSSQCVGGIMISETTNFVNECGKQVTAPDEVPHFEEQTTRMNTKDVSDARQKESMCTHVSMKASRHDQSEKSSQCVGGIMISETTNFVNECGKQVTASDKIQYFEEQMNTKDADVAQQKESRLDDDVTLIGPSSLSHAMEVIKGNKRIGFMGSSCRFRHTNTTNIGDIQNKTQKSDEGVSEGTKSIVTYSSEIKPISHKETPVTNYSFNYADNSPFMRFPHNQVSYARKVEEFVLRSRASSFEWEPTKAFRSNFLISQGVFVPDIRFDPNHNRIESLPKIGERQNVDGATQGNIHKLTQEVSIHKPEFVTVGDTNKGSKPQRDSKPLQCFQAALVESVKGFLKSAWRDGKLSRDAHKQIVKKTVEKVIATLPSNEIPEIKEYLTTSETKLMKLVEGYTANYGKI